MNSFNSACPMLLQQGPELVAQSLPESRERVGGVGLDEGGEGGFQGRGLLRAYEWLSICLLLSLGQVIWAGYRLGVGNQSIQIPFLKHLLDPALYANDPMVTQTQGAYPT